MTIAREVLDYRTGVDTENGGVILIMELSDGVAFMRLHQLDAEKLSRCLSRASDAVADLSRCPKEVNNG